MWISTPASQSAKTIFTTPWTGPPKLDTDFHAEKAAITRLPLREVFATNMTRVQSFERRPDGVVNATDPEFLTRVEMEGRSQAVEYIRFLRNYIPGYRSAGLAAMSSQIGLRETRRIIGDYVLTRDDVLGARQFDDQIGLCGAPIDDHGTGQRTKWVYLPEGQCVAAK